MLFSNLFVKNVVQDLTSAGIDWQREKWQSGLGSKFIHQGEKNAAKYADEVIVLSKGEGMPLSLLEAMSYGNCCLVSDIPECAEVVEDKIKSQLAVKRKRGDFVGSFAAYGYRKDPANHTKLIVDELAAETVQNIFRRKINGMSNQGIADRLNAEKVLSPAARKLQSNEKLSLHFRKSDEPPWSAKAVDRILHNEVYTGKLVQGKTRRLDYRSKKKMNVPMR